MKRQGWLGRWSAGLLLAGVVALGAAGAAEGRNIGMVVGHGQGEVYVFDADTDTLLAALPIGGGLYDCVVTQGGQGYVSDFTNKKIWIINLSNPGKPRLAGSIPLPIAVEDISLSADGRKLLATDAGNGSPLLVIDLTTRTVKASVPAAGGYQSVEVCLDNTVLATSYYPEGTFEEYVLAGDGSLSPQGGVQPMISAINSACEPEAGAAVGVMSSFYGGGGAIHLTGLPGINLEPSGYRDLLGEGRSAVFSPRLDAVFTRNNCHIQRFAYDPDLLTLQPADPADDWAVAGTDPDFGVDKIAVHPLGTKLYVPQNGTGLTVFDADPVAYRGNISLPITYRGELTGVCLPALARVAVDIDADVIDPASVDAVGVVIFGSPPRPVADIVKGSIAFVTNAQAVGKPRTGDFDQDGQEDLLLLFRAIDLGTEPGDVTACLSGKFRDGAVFLGCDVIDVAQ